MELQINPPDTLKVLACLNACFPGWGDERYFQWAFQRALQDLPLPDYMVLTEAGAEIAGSSVSYRRVLLRNGAAITAGIMTGSWTLPEARGKGCFSRIIQESIRITEQRGGALLLAFVTHDNPSCRQLLRAGAAQFPTSYLNGLTQGKALQMPAASTGRVFREVDSLEETLFERWVTSRAGFVRCGYASLADWQSQFVERPTKTILLQRNDGFAVLEEHPDTHRLLAYLPEEGEADADFLDALCQHAAKRGKKLFHFCTDPELTKQLEGRNFNAKPGFITVHAADWKKLAQALGRSTPEEALPHSVLADPASPWFLGEWRLQSGDRM